MCVGDIADGAGDLERTCSLLDAEGVLCVRGNHDRWALAGQMRQLPQASPLGPIARRFLEGLPATRRFDLASGGELELVHGVGDDDMREFRPHDDLERLDGSAARDLAWTVGGHTHTFMCRAVGAGHFVNPGTLRHRGGRPSCFAVLEPERARLERWIWVHGEPVLAWSRSLGLQKADA